MFKYQCISALSLGPISHPRSIARSVRVRLQYSTLRDTVHVQVMVVQLKSKLGNENLCNDQYQISGEHM